MIILHLIDSPKAPFPRSLIKDTPFFFKRSSRFAGIWGGRGSSGTLFLNSAWKTGAGEEEEDDLWESLRYMDEFGVAILSQWIEQIQLRKQPTFCWNFVDWRHILVQYFILYALADTNLQCCEELFFQFLLQQLCFSGLFLCFQFRRFLFFFRLWLDRFLPLLLDQLILLTTEEWMSDKGIYNHAEELLTWWSNWICLWFFFHWSLSFLSLSRCCISSSVNSLDTPSSSILWKEKLCWFNLRCWFL